MAEGGTSTALGYNPSKIEQMIKDMWSSYISLENSINEQWPTFSNVMQENWKRPEEISAEGVLAQTVLNLDDSLCELFVSYADLINQIYKNYIEGEKEMKFTAQDGSNITVSAVDDSKFYELTGIDEATLTADRVNLKEKVKEPTDRTFDENEDWILTADAATAITGALDTFFSEISQAAKDIVAGIDPNAAFFGTALPGSISVLLEAVQRDVDKLTVEQTNLNTQLTNLIGTGAQIDTSVGAMTDNFEGIVDGSDTTAS